jgi:hypothetical protein
MPKAESDYGAYCRGSPSSQACSLASALQPLAIRMKRLNAGSFGAASASRKQFSAFCRKIVDSFILFRWGVLHQIQMSIMRNTLPRCRELTPQAPPKWPRCRQSIASLNFGNPELVEGQASQSLSTRLRVGRGTEGYPSKPRSLIGLCAGT